MSIKIVADSSCNIRSITGIDFVSVPLSVSTNERSFADDDKLDRDEMLEYLAAYSGRSFSACPSVESFIDAYSPADEIYVVTMSSGMSGTYNAARTAARIYKNEHPNAKICIFDTKSAGPTMRLVIEKIRDLVSTGYDFDTVCGITAGYLKNTRLLFALKSYHNFAENGRVNKSVAKIAGALGIRIMATAGDDGKIEIVKKCSGDNGILKSFMEQLDICGYNGGKCYIDHCKYASFAETVSEKIKKAYPGAVISINETCGLCSFYAEEGGVLLSFECKK